jgi:thiosulfate dehydrogenase
MFKKMTPIVALAAGLVAFCVARADTGAQAGGGNKVAPMQQAVDEGAEIFKAERFGGNRIWVPDMAFHSEPMTCEACHTNGGKTVGIMPTGAKIPSLIGAAADFPRYNAKAHQVFTLQRQLVHCIRAGIGGKPPAYDSPTMIDLQVYLIALSKKTAMGKNVP